MPLSGMDVGRRADSMPEWRFRPMSRAELNADPVQGEFFTPEGVTDSLVREVLQNSLDAARTKNEPVRVRFFLGELARGRTAGFFEGLEPHLRQNGLEIPAGKVRYVTIEDFGTRGLAGDPASDSDDPKTSQRNDFFYFWRNVGRSRKERSDLGRWGLGKTVLPAASQINAFFGLTTRVGERHSLLMGQAVLKTHKLRRRKYSPYGYYALFDDSDDFQVPCRNRAHIDTFRKNFGLARISEPGLSLVVPCVADELDARAIAAAVVRHYFVPILRGKLEVSVESKGLDAVAIRKDTIDEVLASFGGQVRDVERARRMFDLARWALERKDTDFFECHLPGGRATPHWGPDAFHRGDVARMTDRYGNDERICVRIRMDVVRQRHTPESAYFDLFLEHDATTDWAEEQFIRGGITITDAGRRSSGKYRGLILIDDPPLVRLLGDSENPAHTQWMERAQAIKQGYVRGPARIRIVRHSAAYVANLVARPSTGLDKTAFRKLFFVPAVHVGDDPDEDRKSPVRGVPALPLPVQPVRVFQTERGFRLAGNPNAPRDGRPLAIRVAYDVRRGDPFARYHPMDFDLEDASVTIHADGCSIRSARANCMIVVPERGEFELSVEGFDTHRDLKIQVRPVVSDDPEA